MQAIHGLHPAGALRVSKSAVLQICPPLATNPTEKRTSDPVRYGTAWPKALLKLAIRRQGGFVDSFRKLYLPFS
jgi:hypothetical protein